MWECMLLLGYECMILVSLMPLNCLIYVNCCHAKDLGCFPRLMCVMWSLKDWLWGFYVKIRILHSGLTNARLSVHCSSSVQNVVTKGYARLRARSSVLTSKLHASACSTCTTFLKILLMVRDAIWCFSLQTFVTLSKPQCQETNAHYILKYYKWNAWVTLTYFNGEWRMWAR